jgi:UDP-N-acetylglucosamine transferase subunit ALG13
VLIQTGASRYTPRFAEWFRFDSPDRIDSLIGDARVVVTHAGAGTLLAALEGGRSVVAVPRLASLGEHVDDHQLELCEALERAGLIRVVADVSDLTRALSTEHAPATWSPTPRTQLTATIADAIAELSPVSRRLRLPR